MTHKSSQSAGQKPEAQELVAWLDTSSIEGGLQQALNDHSPRQQGEAPGAQAKKCVSACVMFFWGGQG